MIAQLCNSHGFPHGWIQTRFHHEVFRAVTSQIEELYDGECIIVDDTWLKNINKPDVFAAMYPNVMLTGIDHIFVVCLVDP